MYMCIAFFLPQDLLTVELRRSSREAPYPDRLSVHRKGKPGQQEEEPLAHELRCWSNIPQVHILASIRGSILHILYMATLLIPMDCHTGTEHAVQAGDTMLSSAKRSDLQVSNSITSVSVCLIYEK